MANAGDKRKSTYKVKSIDTNATIAYSDASKGTYNGVELIYERSYQGKAEVKTKNFAMKSLDHPANATTKASLMALTKGETFTVDEEFDGNYWNWKTVTKGGQVVDHPAAQAKQGGGNFQRKDAISTDNKSGMNDYELGVTCGMCLNNAVALLGQGATMAQVEGKAQEFFAMAVRFKEQAKSGQFDKITGVAVEQVASAPQQAEHSGDFDDDIPF